MLAATNLLFTFIKWALYICDLLGWFSSARQILWLNFLFSVIFTVFVTFSTIQSDSICGYSIKLWAYIGSL
jgi:hypothetical protein